MFPVRILVMIAMLLAAAPLANAPHGRGSSRLGPAAIQHNDEWRRRTDISLRRWPDTDAQIQGRREEDRGVSRDADRDLRAGRKERAEARNADFHFRRDQTAGRH